MSNDQQETKVNFPLELQGGVYANNMVLTHTSEEFIMDFLMVTGSSATVTARLVVSPGHIKRITAAMQDGINKYEERFGSIKILEAGVKKGEKKKRKG